MIRFFTTLFIPLLCLVMVGCLGGDGEINIDTPPPISEAKRVTVVRSSPMREQQKM